MTPPPAVDLTDPRTLEIVDAALVFGIWCEDLPLPLPATVLPASVRTQPLIPRELQHKRPKVEPPHVAR
jgi:hypothetical protein